MRVVLGKRAARRHRRREHRGLRLLRQLDHVRDGPVRIHRRAHDERGTLATPQGIGELGHRGRGRSETRGPRPGGHRHAGLVPVIGGDRDEDRAVRRGCRQLIGAHQGRRDVGGAGRFVAPLHIRLGEGGGVGGAEERLVEHQAAGLLPGRHDHRRPVAVRGEDRALRMAHAAGGMQVDQHRFPPGLRVAVGHRDHRGLLQAQHVAEVVRPPGQERHLGRARIAEYRGQPELPHQPPGDVADRAVLAAHRSPPSSCVQPPSPASLPCHDITSEAAEPDRVGH